MIHIIALARRPFKYTILGVDYTITKISHDNGALIDLECSPVNSDLRELVSANLQTNKDLKLMDLDRQVERLNRRPTLAQKRKTEGEQAAPSNRY